MWVSVSWDLERCSHIFMVSVLCVGGKYSQNDEPVSEIPIRVNQIQEVIRMYKTQGHGTNQATMEIAMPSDILLKDPPCLRLIDTRVREGRLHFIVYFRSWDLWGGFPVNLGGLQLMKEYMASEIGVEDGEIFAFSKVAEMRTGRKIERI